MLRELTVEGVGVIEHAELLLQPGTTALTGETGAGKTLVVAAVSLLLSGRADKSLVRAGTTEARVEALFTLERGHPAIALLAAHGILDDDSLEVVVSRSIPADGRASRVRINGRMVTSALVEEVGVFLVEIAGQHGHQRLFAPAFQRALLDGYAGAEAMETAEVVARTVREAATARRELDRIVEGSRARAREIDVLHHEVEEIEAAGISVDEEEQLRGQAARLEHAEGIAAAIASARRQLRGDGGAEEVLVRAATAIRDGASKDPALNELADRVDAAAIEVSDVAGELARLEITPDPERLEQIRGRLAVLSRLRRKYGDSASDVLDHLEEARTRLAELTGEAEDRPQLEGRLDELEGAAHDAAQRLSELRSAAAVRLAGEASAVMQELAVPDARLIVHLEPRSLYEGGVETVELRAQMNPGDEPRPLAKVASGGELSRAALALHALTAEPAAATLIFDEVDAGVGGRSAQAVGRYLAQLGSRPEAQVVVVTHLPQVAAFADEHYRVVKSGSAARVERVEGGDRVEELSRMLAGLPESERAKDHARELLELAREGAKG